MLNQYGQYDNMFPPIVSVSLYEYAQKVRNQRQVNRRSSDNRLKQKIKCPCCGSTLTNMTIRKTNHSLRYYVCPKNMNASRFICDFKGINAENLEKQVLESCQKFFRDQQLYSKIKHAIEKQLKKQRMHDTSNTLTQEKLIENLAQGKIDVETFREQSQSINLQNKPIQAISDTQLQTSLQKVIQKSFTLNMLYPYIDEIHITKNKELSGIYIKNEPLNIVNQTIQSSTG